MGIKESFKVYQEFNKYLTEMSEDFILRFECNEEYFDTMTFITIIGDIIEANYDSYNNSYGQRDEHTAFIPLKYFTEDVDWEDLEQTKRYDENMAALKRRVVKESEEKRKKEELEYEQYLRLKKKYEDKP